MKLDASVLGAVRHRDTVDVQKISSLVGAGQAIELLDGRRFRVQSKIAGAGTVSFYLTNPVGSLRVTASELAVLQPLPRGIARLAHVLRRYAYNNDFTEYVNEAVKAHGFDIDPKMNWSKWLYDFAKKYLLNANKSVNRNDAVDEALHQYIIELLYEKDVLSSFDPKKIKEERNASQPLERQVSIYLMQQFITYRSMAIRAMHRLNTTTPGEKNNAGIRENLNTPMVQPTQGELGEGEGEANILDTMQHAQQPNQGGVESWEDIARFRKEFAEWLQKNEHADTTDSIIKLFDLIVSAEQEAGSGSSDSGDYKEKWMAATGKSLSSFGVAARKLSETLQEFVTEHPELSETSLIARLIGDIKAKKPTTQRKVEGPNSVPRAASLRLVALAPSDLAQIPGDTGQLPHDNTGNTSSAVIIVDEKGANPQQQQRTVAPEIPAIQHGS